jgi:hypothetical protein
MKKHYSDLPTLINCLTGYRLTKEDLYNPRTMAGAFEQMAHEVWRFAPFDQAHRYQKFLPFDYVWHRLSLHFNDPEEEIAHTALGEMLDMPFKHDWTKEITLTLRT